MTQDTLPRAISASAQALKDQWPQTWAACCRSYFDEATFGVTRADGGNDAGYLFAACIGFAQTARSRLAYLELTDSDLDYVAAAEVDYQHVRRRTFAKPAQALAACICNKIKERPSQCAREARFKRAAVDVGGAS